MKRRILSLIATAAAVAAVVFAACSKGGDGPETAAPVITIGTHPAPTTSVTAGAITGSLSVAATVTEKAALSYQWYSNTTNSNTGGTTVSGATSAVFPIPTTLAAGTYYYFCEVRATDATSKRSNAATVNVSTAPLTKSVNIGAQSGTVTAGTGGTATYAVTTGNIADGRPGAITWYTTLAGTTEAAKPAFVTQSVTALSSDASTVTMDASSAAAAKDYFFEVAYDGIFSSVATLAVGEPAFVAITDITGVPTGTVAGTPLTLTGTVAPSNATNKTIAWSVKNANSTGATISGSTLNRMENIKSWKKEKDKK